MFQIRIHGRGGQGVVSAAEMLSIAAFEQGSLYPALPRIREVSAHIAAAVAATANRSGLAGTPPAADMLEHIQAQMFNPRYQ